MFTFRRINTNNSDLSSVQDNISDVFRVLSLNQLLDGTLLTGIVVATGNNVINHTLSRTPLGYVVTDKNAAADIYRTAWDNRTLTLNSSAAANISIWVF